MIHQKRVNTPCPSPRFWSVIILGGVILAAWSSGAHAQINPFRGYNGPTLSKEDFAAGNAAAQKLLTDDQGELGKSERWAGPTSGNTGILTVEKSFRRQGMECRTLKSEVRYKKTATSPRTLNLNVCRLHSGEWKLM